MFKVISVDKKVFKLTSFCSGNTGVIGFYVRPPGVAKIFEKVTS